MISKFLLLFFCLALTACAKKDNPPFRKLGDYAPPFHISKWIKGEPVEGFKKGKVYVVEFWATWCTPCIEAMPHLSELGRQYKDKVDIVAVDVLEYKSMTVDKVTAFVDSMGARMDFRVAVQDSNLMQQVWLQASAEDRYGIPRTFVIDTEGKVAWIGHPANLDAVLAKIVNGTWDLKQEAAIYNDKKYLDSLDWAANLKLSMFLRRNALKGQVNIEHPEDIVKPDSVLFVVDEFVKKEPRLKYAPLIADFTFLALLKTNPHKAYEYGRKVIVTSTYEEPAYSSIIYEIENYSGSSALPADIYRLGAEAYQLQIDQIDPKGLNDLQQRYRKMASMYRQAGDKSKAIEAEQKAAKF